MIDSLSARGGLTVGIASRNRRESLSRALPSLSWLRGWIREVIVADCGYDDPLLLDELKRMAQGCEARVSRVEVSAEAGYVAGRNRIAAAAQTRWLLSMDDDALVLNRSAIDSASTVLRTDAMAGAVAFAQGNERGEAYPDFCQAARVPYRCESNTYIGFAVLHDLEVFRSLGGYWDPLSFYGEEKDYCLRLRASGRRVVYLPDAVVGHLADPVGRSSQRYLRYYNRNDCLTALRLFPWPLAAVVVCRRLRGYSAVALANLGSVDEEGGRWIRSEVRRLWPQVRASRRSVGHATLWNWRRNRLHPKAYV